MSLKKALQWKVKWKTLGQAGQAEVALSRGTVHAACTLGPWKQERRRQGRDAGTGSLHPPMACTEHLHALVGNPWVRTACDHGAHLDSFLKYSVVACGWLPGK